MSETITCTKCDEVNPAEARVCKLCAAPLKSFAHSATDAELMLFVESKKKSGWIAALLNLFLPGAGYAYCGRWVLAIVAFLFVVAAYIATLGLAAIALSVALFIDGFLCARRYNKHLIEDVLSTRQSAKVS